MTRADMRALTDGLKSKSAKIRALGAVGASRSEIADVLGIRYQFVYNVLNASNASEPAPAVAGPASGGDGELSLEALIRAAHAKGFAITFHPLKPV